jgi:CRP/FNR family transcriptional regulator, anaerobic regulatory protein
MKSNCVNAEWLGRAKCQVCEVRQLVLFSELELQKLDGILHPIDNMHLPAGGVLYQRGAPGSHVFTLRTGFIKLIQELSNGSQRIVRLLKAGDVVGLEALLGDAYHHTAVALRDVDFCRIPAEVLQQLDHLDPRLHEQLFKRWQRSVDQADQIITEFSTGSAEARVARFLMHTADGGGHDAPMLLGREDMGELLGITTETASRVIAEFKRRGLVKEEKGICAGCDYAGLSKLAAG